MSQIYTYKNVTAIRAAYKQSLKDAALLPSARLSFYESPAIRNELPEIAHYISKKLLMHCLHSVHAPGSLIVWKNHSAMVLEDSWIINGGTPREIWMPQYLGGNGMRVFLRLLPK